MKQFHPIETIDRSKTSGTLTRIEPPPLPRRVFLISCDVFRFLLVSRQGMTNYHLRPPTATLPSLAVQEAKEKRRQVLARAEQTRKANYQRFLQRMASLEKTIRAKHRRLQANGDLATIV